MSDPRRRFTLVELLVVIAIISILAGMLLPALNRARASAQSTSCLSQEKQVMLGVLMYADEYDGFGPGVGNTNQNILDSTRATGTGVKMHGNLLPYVAKQVDLFHCPSDSGHFWRTSGVLGVNFGTSYGHTILRPPPATTSDWAHTLAWRIDERPLNNQNKNNGNQSRSAARIAFMGDYGWAWSAPNKLLYQYHSAGYNVGFLDGHAQNYKAELFNNEWNKGYYRVNW